MNESTKERVLTAMQQGRRMNIGDIAQAAKMPSGEVSAALHALVKDGLVIMGPLSGNWMLQTYEKK